MAKIAVNSPIRFRTTYDFAKLHNKMREIIGKHLNRHALSTADGAKANIDKGVKPSLAQSTIKTRKAKGITGTKPLYETGNLHGSIMSTKKGKPKLKMLKYGIYHHRGEGVPERKFITPTKSDFKKNFDKFKKDVREAFKKW